MHLRGEEIYLFGQVCDASIVLRGSPKSGGWQLLGECLDERFSAESNGEDRRDADNRN
jgi:hypothetical protein